EARELRQDLERERGDLSRSRGEVRQLREAYCRALATYGDLRASRRLDGDFARIDDSVDRLLGAYGERDCRGDRADTRWLQRPPGHGRVGSSRGYDYGRYDRY